MKIAATLMVALSATITDAASLRSRGEHTITHSPLHAKYKLLYFILLHVLLYKLTPSIFSFFYRCLLFYSFFLSITLLFTPPPLLQ